VLFQLRSGTLILAISRGILPRPLTFIKMMDFKKIINVQMYSFSKNNPETDQIIMNSTRKLLITINFTEND
jgi:hypothetical protein